MMDSITFQFIDTEQSAPNKKTTAPASYVRQSFAVDGPVSKATLYTTALGVYIPYFNGFKVSEQMLLPGFTDYSKRVQYLTTDITDLVREGKNTIAAIVNDGWYRGALGAASKRCVYGDKIKFAATVKIETADGIRWIRTNETARATQDGPIVASDIKMDEIVDMRKEDSGWSEPDFDDSAWHACPLASYAGTVIAQEGEPVLEHERFTPKILHTPNGETVLDFGQNMSGRVQFTVTGHAGDTVKLVLGEALSAEGNFTTFNVSADEGSTSEGIIGKLMLGRLGQTVTYTLKEGTQTYKSHFLVSGFRYAKVVDWPEEVKAENFEAIAIYSDLTPTGSFECSNPKINQFVSNVRWSWKSNSVDIPTDCPQRERAGWTGDINVFSETACWLYDTKKFLLKWFNDYMGMQKESGSLPYIVPDMGTGDFSNDAAGWSDALINVAMVLYRYYGDEEVLETVYEAAKKYVDYNLGRAKKRHPLHLNRREPWYQYILDTGYHWGEWLEPGSDMVQDMLHAAFLPDAEVATAWLYSSAYQLSQMAAILHKEEDQGHYHFIAQQIRDAYRKEFLRDGKVDSTRQCRYVRPLYLGLVEGDEARAIAADLNDLIVANDYKIGTGFLTTYKILPTLTDFGYAETAYKMMEQEQCPGWLYEVTKGATTTWENWDGINDRNEPNNSLNHYGNGTSCAWLFSHVGGIQPLEPGFGKVRIQPIPGGTLTYANTSYVARRGKIVSNWKIEDGQFCLHVEIPEAIDAEVVLPDGSSHSVGAGFHDFACASTL